MAFRGAAKSTIIEEVVTVQGCQPTLLSKLGKETSPIPFFRNCVILGASEEKAVERILSIRNEFENNEVMQLVFGDLVGHPWGETKIVLSNGSAIQARGKDQSMRGLKHLTWRPDLLVLDDYEDEEDVETPAARHKLWQRFLKVVLPSMDPKGRAIMLATPMHPESIPMRLMDPEQGGWFRKVYPIEVPNPETGERVPLWPSRFPLEVIDERRGIYERTGSLVEWEQEYMCRAESEGDRQFREDMFRDHGFERSFEAVWVMVDPARTIGTKSASTAIVAFSWVGVRLIVWECRIGLFMPDEIVDHIFEMDERYNPVAVGFEEDGLNEWALQPIRRRMVDTGRVIPLKPMRAPRSKIDFIKGLQPFFKAGEVSFANGCEELRRQFMSFPRGRIDGPNALAYAPRMRAGPPIYDDFSMENISAVRYRRDRSIQVAVSAEGSTLAAVACQFDARGCFILWDQIYEGDMSDVVVRMLREVSIEFPGRVRFTAPPEVLQDGRGGISDAARRVPFDLDSGTAPSVGRAEIKRMLRERTSGQPSLLISPEARWSANGFSGGYARDVSKGDLGPDRPVKNVYAVLMSALESLVGLTAYEDRYENHEQGANFQYTSDGRRFMSALRRGS